jgi:hypothetical protein
LTKQQVDKSNGCNKDEIVLNELEEVVLITEETEEDNSKEDEI